MTTTRDIDTARAEAFFATCQLDTLLSKYDSELDSELRDDMVKLGNYLAYREQGVKPVWAKMSACRKAAVMNGSDKDFNASERRKMERMNPKHRARIQALAKSAGISTQGKFYVGALGNYMNPRAWVSDVSDVKTSAKEQGFSINGIVDYESGAENLAPKLSKKAEDQLVHRELQADPALARKVREKPSILRNVRQRVAAKHAAKA